jgi:preprotein translocase subunit SecA
VPQHHARLFGKNKGQKVNICLLTRKTLPPVPTWETLVLQLREQRLMWPIIGRLLGDGRSSIFLAVQRDADAAKAFENRYAELSASDLVDRSTKLRARASALGLLDSLLPEAFALVAEASFRALGLRHYRVQMMGGAVLHRRHVAEMRTGEGKTLVALLTAYLNALAGKGVHVVTVNDYLARRDAAEAASVMALLGMTVGCVVPDTTDECRRNAYAADITYATHAEIGFDYLRDNMRLVPRDVVGRPFHFAIVDELDSVLIDEARVPLVIASEGPKMEDQVRVAADIVDTLTDKHWDEDLMARSVHLTDEGLDRVEQLLRERGLLAEDAILHGAGADGASLVPLIHQALRARVLFKRDRDYIVLNGAVALVDTGTGRVLEGRRYSDGLHQALEAAENVAVLPEQVTVASITYQNLFQLYPGLSGMTGTAASSSDELYETYKLQVVALPTHRPLIRDDRHDRIFMTAAIRDEAVVEAVAAAQARGQPVLVGTASVSRSEDLSAMFKRHGIPHQVLNARNHADEAMVIAQAGRVGAVTIATNMAGRGTDIRLGGNPTLLAASSAEHTKDNVMAADRERARYQSLCAREADEVRASGGLLVIGTERHESRRIDDQLRGRSGRQGDPGATCFMTSLEDPLVRELSGPRLTGLLQSMAVSSDGCLTHPWLTRFVLKAQQRRESQAFEARKNLVKYDKVAAKQRAAFFRHRTEILNSQAMSETLRALRNGMVVDAINEAMPKHTFPEQWNTDLLHVRVLQLLGIDLPIQAWAAEEGVGPDEIAERVLLAAEHKDAPIIAVLGKAVMDDLERQIMLRSMDASWSDFLQEADAVRQGIGLRSFGQRDPLHEWYAESDRMFRDMYRRSIEAAVIMLAQMKLTLPDPEAASS